MIEPFVGSGAVFLNTNYEEYLLTDSNCDLVNLYTVLQNSCEELIECTRCFFIPQNNQAEKYYELRAEFNGSKDELRKAALFVYLNRHCYNGLCRYNSKGKFNVPFGRYSKLYFPEEEMRFFAAKSQGAVFEVRDFREVMPKAHRKRDVIYADPPYAPLSATASFTGYSEKAFGEQEQRELARLAEKLAENGVPVLISNHETELTLEIYWKAKLDKFEVNRFISCKGKSRNKVRELLAFYRV